MWEGRFKSSLLDQERYCLTCYRYFELTTVHAGMVQHPGDCCFNHHGVHTDNETTAAIVESDQNT